MKLKVLSVLVILLISIVKVYSIPNLDSLEKSLPSAKGEKKLYALAELAWYYHNIKPTKGIYFANEGLKLAKEKNLLRYETEFTATLGANYTVLGDYDNALKHYFQAVNYVKQLNDSLSLASYYLNIGTIYRNKNLYDSALYYIHKSKEIYERSKMPAKVSSSYANMASIYESLFKYDKAEEYYRKALKIKIQQNDSSGMAMVYNNIALVYQKRGKLNKAQNYLYRALEISRAIGDSNGVMTAYANIGLNYDLKKDFKSALNTYKRILPYALSTEDPNLISDLYNYIADAYYNLKEYDKALENVRKSLAISQKKNLFEAMEESYNLLRLIYEAKNDYKSAYKYTLKTLEIHDTLFDVKFNSALAKETARATSELQVKLEVEKKNNEINQLTQKHQRQRYYLIILLIIVGGLIILSVIGFILHRTIVKKNKFLNEVNALLKRKDKELTKTIAVKDKFFRIISHDLKTPISIFLHISDYLKKNINNMKDEEIKQFVADIHTTAKSLNALLESLLLWAKVQTGMQEIQAEPINLALPVKKVLSEFEKDAEAKKIKLNSGLADDIKIKSDLNMLIIIIRNLISNAIKYTREGGEVTVRTYSKGDKAVFEVADTGVGIPEEVQGKIFSYEKIQTYGTNKETGAGIGLLLSKALAEVNNAEIEFESEKGKGSTFRVLFPLIRE